MELSINFKAIQFSMKALEILIKKNLFRTALLCSAFVCIFAFTNISLNGYKTDVYFFVATLALNLVAFRVLLKRNKKRVKPYINLVLATLQFIGLVTFFLSDSIQVDKVYMQRNNKYNLYSSTTGWYKRAYFLPQAKGCNDGELWETKVPYYFPLIEIETERDPCHKVGIDTKYATLFTHVPE